MGGCSPQPASAGSGAGAAAGPSASSPAAAEGARASASPHRRHAPHALHALSPSSHPHGLHRAIPTCIDRNEPLHIQLVWERKIKSNELSFEAWTNRTLRSVNTYHSASRSYTGWKPRMVVRAKVSLNYKKIENVNLNVSFQRKNIHHTSQNLNIRSLFNGRYIPCSNHSLFPTRTVPLKQNTTHYTNNATSAWR